MLLPKFFLFACSAGSAGTFAALRRKRHETDALRRQVAELRELCEGYGGQLFMLRMRSHQLAQAVLQANIGDDRVVNASIALEQVLLAQSRRRNNSAGGQRPSLARG